MLNLRQVDQNSGNSLSNTAHISTILFNTDITLNNIEELLEFSTRRFDDSLEDESKANVVSSLSDSSVSYNARTL
jgi:hypothetical protein